MEFTNDHQPELRDDQVLAPDRAAPDDAQSRALWQELHSYEVADGGRDDGELAAGPVGTADYQQQSPAVMRAGTLTVAPVMLRERGGSEHGGMAGDEAASAGDNVGDGPGATGDSGQPPRGADSTRERSDDDGQLPKREQVDEKTLPADEQEAVIEVGRAVIDRNTADDGTRTLSLPDGNQSTYQVREADGARVASNWRIDVNEQQRDLGIGRRLAKATADDLIRKGVDRLDVTVDSEAALRTLLNVFDGSIEYTDQTDTPIETPQQALAELERRAAHEGDTFSGLSARVNIQDFANRHLEYQTGPDERVFDRCDFSKIHAGPDGMYGEVDQLRQRILALPEPHATNTTLAFNELLANYNAHVVPSNPGERYEVRLSWVRDPDSFKSHVRLTNYFFGNVGPGVVEGINLHLLGSEDVFYGESREASGAQVDPQDVAAAHELEEKGDDVTARLQQTGRGLATIARVSSRAMVVRFPQELGGGGGFIIDLKDVEVAAHETVPSERPPGVRDDETDVDTLIDHFLSNFREDEI